MNTLRFIKKIITAKKQEMYYVGDGSWFGRTSKANALEGLANGQYSVWSIVDKSTGTESYGVFKDGQIVAESDQVNEEIVEEQNELVYEVVDSENVKMIGEKFPTIEQLEDFLNEKAANETSIKIWVRIPIPNTENHTYGFKCETYDGLFLNLKAYCMQSLKSSIQYCSYDEESSDIYKHLLNCCEKAWGLSRSSDCRSYSKKTSKELDREAVSSEWMIENDTQLTNLVQKANYSSQELHITMSKIISKHQDLKTKYTEWVNLKMAKGHISKIISFDDWLEIYTMSQD